jgi:hypothetical protein
MLAQALPPLAEVRPAGLRWEIKAHQLVVTLHQVLRHLAASELPRQAIQLILKHIGEALEEDQRQDVVLKLRGVHRPANDTGRLP